LILAAFRKMVSGALSFLKEAGAEVA